MRILRSLDELRSADLPSLVTIGNFDGVHRGHRMVIASMLTRAHELNARSVAVTFDPHPAHVLHEGPRLKLITPIEQKLELLAATGLDLTLVLPFDEALRCWSARHFATRVLRDGLHTLEVHEGETFRFGHRAEADIDGLVELGRECGFAVTTHLPRILRGSPVSSSRIRALIAAGEVSQARALLGRSFSVRSTPARGRGYGTRYTVPTINLTEYTNLLPAHGVYITTLRVGVGPVAHIFRGVTNVGNRPTFGTDSFAVETHLLDLKAVSLDENTPLELTFLKRLRAEHRFASPAALRTQISTDVACAQRYFSLRHRLLADLVRA